MGTYESSGEFELYSPAVDFIEHLTRKRHHVSFFFAAVDLRFEVEPEEPESTTATVNILGNLIWENYDSVTATFTVGEDMPTNYLTYIFEFEGFSNKIEDAKIVESLLTYIRLSDSSYDKNIKHNSLDAGYPADECFQDFVNAFEDDDEVEMGDVDWPTRTFTISFDASSMIGNFETVEVTITVTPRNEGSRLKWTVEVEKIDDTEEEESAYFLILACFIRETIWCKLRG